MNINLTVTSLWIVRGSPIAIPVLSAIVISSLCATAPSDESDCRLPNGIQLLGATKATASHPHCWTWSEHQAILKNGQHHHHSSDDGAEHCNVGMKNFTSE